MQRPLFSFTNNPRRFLGYDARLLGKKIPTWNETLSPGGDLEEEVKIIEHWISDPL
jgi:hypothetical protein